MSFLAARQGCPAGSPPRPASLKQPKPNRCKPLCTAPLSRDLLGPLGQVTFHGNRNPVLEGWQAHPHPLPPLRPPRLPPPEEDLLLLRLRPDGQAAQLQLGQEAPLGVKRDSPASLANPFAATPEVGGLRPLNSRGRVKVDHRHDVPFLGGCATDVKTVYIDRHLPRLWRSGPHLARVEPFVTLHECVEFALMGTFGPYKDAHAIARAAEQVAVAVEGLSWRQYERFTKAHQKQVEDDRMEKVPADLDLEPYEQQGNARHLRKAQRRRTRKPAELTAPQSEQPPYRTRPSRTHAGVAKPGQRRQI